jgi:hypothetical protein
VAKRRRAGQFYQPSSRMDKRALPRKMYLAPCPPRRLGAWRQL